MKTDYTEGQRFKGQDYTETALPKGEYENCIFSDCIFSNSDLTEIIFSECQFENCDLSMAKLNAKPVR